MNVIAHVEVKLRIELNQPWDENCPAFEISKQAQSSAIMQITNLINSAHNIKIAGKPEVKMVVSELPDLVEEKES